MIWTLLNWAPLRLVTIPESQKYKDIYIIWYNIQHRAFPSFSLLQKIVIINTSLSSHNKWFSQHQTLTLDTKAMGTYKVIVLKELNNFCHFVHDFSQDVKNATILYNLGVNHGLRKPGEEIAFIAQPKIYSRSQILRYCRSIFCLPHRPKFQKYFF